MTWYVQCWEKYSEFTFLLKSILYFIYTHRNNALCYMYCTVNAQNSKCRPTWMYQKFTMQDVTFFFTSKNILEKLQSTSSQCVAGKLGVFNWIGLYSIKVQIRSKLYHKYSTTVNVLSCTTTAYGHDNTLNLSSSWKKLCIRKWLIHLTSTHGTHESAADIFSSIKVTVSDLPFARFV